MVDGHKIKKKIEVDEFLEHIREYDKEDIETTEHTFFRLNDKQRKIYNDSLIKDIISTELPFFVGIQNNNLWAIFYKYNKSIFRFIVDLQPNKIYIVTFYIIDEDKIPRI